MVDGGASPVGPDVEPAQETVREERLQQGWRKELSKQGPREELHQQSRREELLQQGQREDYGWWRGLYIGAGALG